LPKVAIHYGNFLVSQKWAGLLAAGDANNTTSRHLGCLTGVVGLFEPARQRLTAHTAKRFLQPAQSADRHRL
jgi:hypothetical protein